MKDYEVETIQMIRKTFKNKDAAEVMENIYRCIIGDSDHFDAEKFGKLPIEIQRKIAKRVEIAVKNASMMKMQRESEENEQRN